MRGVTFDALKDEMMQTFEVEGAPAAFDESTDS